MIKLYSFVINIINVSTLFRVFILVNLPRIQDKNNTSSMTKSKKWFLGFFENKKTVCRLMYVA